MRSLSPKTKGHIAALFAPTDQARAESMLLGLLTESERIMFAALRFSHGDLGVLGQAIELAKTDWRDLLVAGGFAADVDAHERWVPRTVTPAMIETWNSGCEIDGVRFFRGDAVELRRGDLVGGSGTVRSLDALEPEPQYTVVLAGGREVRTSQFHLQPAG